MGIVETSQNTMAQYAVSEGLPGQLDDKDGKCI